MADAADETKPVVTEEAAAKPEGEATEAKEKKEKKPKAKAKSGGKKGQGKGKPDGPTWGGQGYRLNVKNFGNETNEELKALFEPFGTVVDAQVRMNEGKSRGFGFVIFSTEEDAKKAIEAMHDKEHNGKKLNVMPAERRAEEPAAKGKGKGKGGADTQMAMFQQQQMAYQYAQMQQYVLAHQYLMAQQAQQYAGGYDPHGTWFPPAAPAADANATYEGSIKSINKYNKYAFIVCRTTHELYGRDIYLEGSMFPEGMKQSSRVKFGVELTRRDKGNGKVEEHPKATWCQLA